MQLTRNDEGDCFLDVVQQRTVHGTIQPLNGQETVTYLAGSRDTGSVKIYSSEKLSFRSEDGERTGFVKSEGSVFELVQQMSFQNVGAISHYKYIASLVPPSQIPEALK